jgi:hypothetical protein
MPSKKKTRNPIEQNRIISTFLCIQFQSHAYLAPYLAPYPMAAYAPMGSHSLFRLSFPNQTEHSCPRVV